MELKAQVEKDAARLSELEEKEKELQGKITKIMMTIPNIIDPSVPIGKDDSCNVETKNLVSRSYRILKSHIIQRLWSVLTALT